jgi:hypothetical protein
MKLSAFHEAHGLNGTIRSKATGETLHFQFDKTGARIPLVVTIGGHQVEGALVLTRLLGEKGDFDMGLALALGDRPGTAPSGTPAVPAGGVEAPTLRVEAPRTLRAAAMDVAEDGEPLKPVGAPRQPSPTDHDETMGPRTPGRPITSMASFRDPAAEVVDNPDTRALVAGSDDPAKMSATAPATPAQLTPADVRLPDYDDGGPVSVTGTAPQKESPPVQNGPKGSRKAKG